MADCGAIGSNKNVHAAFENIHSFLSWLDVKDVLEAAKFQRYVWRRKDGTFVRIVGSGK